MISLREVTKTYGTNVTIGPLTVDIPVGGITALVGPNGAGKSTALTMIGRLLAAERGQIEVAGINVARAPSRTVAQLLAILRQENHFVTRLTVRQLVGFGRFPYSRGRLSAEDEQRVSLAIDFLDLAELEGRFLDELSGGQRQRAYVAMVLAQDTDYLLLDEPLNNLDMAHSAQMMRQLKSAAVELNRTIVVVLHDINFAGRYADRICAMTDGQITEYGTCAEIMRAEVLSRVFGTEVQIVDGPHGPLAVYY